MIFLFLQIRTDIMNYCSVCFFPEGKSKMIGLHGYGIFIRSCSSFQCLHHDSFDVQTLKSRSGISISANGKFIEE